MLIKLDIQRFAPSGVYVNGSYVSLSLDIADPTWEGSADRNTSEYSISNNKVVWNDNTILTQGNEDVLPTDKIQMNGAYTTRAKTPEYMYWKLNSAIALPSSNFTLNFISNNISYTAIQVINSNLVYTSDGVKDIVYTLKNDWSDTVYQLIQVDKTSTDYASFVAWAKANGGVLLEAGTYKWVASPNFEAIGGTVEEPTAGTAGFIIFSFTSNSTEWNALSVNYVTTSTNSIATYAPPITTEFYNVNHGGWTDEAYRTITTTTDQYIDYDFYVYAIDGEQLVKQEVSTYSFKHFYANEEVGTGIYRFKWWSVAVPTPMPQLETPSGLKVTDNILTFGAIENATSYEIFVDNVSIGTYVVPSRFKYVLKSTGIVAPTNTIDETINFLNLVGDSFTRIQIESEGKGTHISYFNNTVETNVLVGGFGVTGDNATIIFETEPTGDLLTWLQENGTKQSGGGSVIKAGTYVIKESPTLNIDIYITLNGKMNTLTADNTYGEMTTFDNFTVAASSPVQIGGVYFTNTENEMTINYAPDTWTFLSDDEYTTTDTTKIRTIVIENDQNVTQEIKTWWVENTNEKTGYTVTYTNSANSSAPCKYSLDGGNTWTTITESSGTIENVETIQFRLDYDGTYACTVKSTTLGLNENSMSGAVTTDTYTLSEDISDLDIR